jgi:lipopolysaccharide transport system ATP-binding protein
VSGEAFAIVARGLRKVYRVYARPIDPLIEAVRRVSLHSERVALDCIDLELKRGEIVGILGRNGAGKSTLLKIIAGTLDSSAGELEVRGRITAILELGTGFHPDYTGRENIFMGGLCLGMSRAEIEDRLDSIIDFSELREVIDQPFKTYSTGMQARLTFSTAISVDPDILIVDEALSVGDARFQMKCFGWIQRLKQRNATVLLVSHDTNTITMFCDRALILENGRVFAEGEAHELVRVYHRLLFGKPPANEDGSVQGAMERDTLLVGDPSSLRPEGEGAGRIQPEEISSTASGLAYGNGKGRIVEYGLLNDHGQRAMILHPRLQYKFFLVFEALADLSDYSPAIAIRDRRGTVVFGLSSLTQGVAVPHLRQGERLLFECVWFNWLARGDYSITFGVGEATTGEKIAFYDPGLSFKVEGVFGIFTTSIVNLEATTEYKLMRTQGALETEGASLKT